MANYDEKITQANKFFNAVDYNNRGVAYESLSDNKKARADFARSKQLGYGEE